jgi:hypothetical protein
VVARIFPYDKAVLEFPTLKGSREAWRLSIIFNWEE